MTSFKAVASLVNIHIRVINYSFMGQMIEYYTNVCFFLSSVHCSKPLYITSQSKNSNIPNETLQIIDMYSC